MDLPSGQFTYFRLCRWRFHWICVSNDIYEYVKLHNWYIPGGFRVCACRSRLPSVYMCNSRSPWGAFNVPEPRRSLGIIVIRVSIIISGDNSVCSIIFWASSSFSSKRCWYQHLVHEWGFHDMSEVHFEAQANSWCNYKCIYLLGRIEFSAYPAWWCGSVDLIE
jgi:hypothetical protein